jgi:hypothetical protein
MSAPMAGKLSRVLTACLLFEPEDGVIIFFWKVNICPSHYLVSLTMLIILSFKWFSPVLPHKMYIDSLFIYHPTKLCTLLLPAIQKQYIISHFRRRYSSRFSLFRCSCWHSNWFPNLMPATSQSNQFREPVSQLPEDRETGSLFIIQQSISDNRWHPDSQEIMHYHGQ